GRSRISLCSGTVPLGVTNPAACAKLKRLCSSVSPQVRKKSAWGELWQLAKAHDDISVGCTSWMKAWYAGDVVSTCMAAAAVGPVVGTAVAQLPEPVLWVGTGATPSRLAPASSQRLSS